jgi:hypothetical protein
MLFFFVAASALLLLAACGQLLPMPGGDCGITQVGAEARRDANNNQVDVFDYRLIGGMCGDVHVNASYNVGTKEAQEKLERAGMTATSSWSCSSDPWTNQVVTCSRIDMRFSGTINASQDDIEKFETATLPLSVIPLAPIGSDTLRGQLGNALKNLPDPVAVGGFDGVVERCLACDFGLPPAPAAPAPPANVPNPTTGQIVQKGASGPSVEAIQYLLNQSGADVSVDGDFGDQTDAAVRAFQQKKGLQPDGKVGPNTWAALWMTLRKDAPEDDAVRALQTLLNWHNQDIEIDGDFGDLTEKAVRTFQAAKRLTVDGVAGQATWTALVNK